MDEINEEVYTTIFNALRHGVRRNILRMLQDCELSFSLMEERLGLSSSHLTYHLDELKDLVSKTDSGYKLSLFGEAAVEMIEKVEEPPTQYSATRFNPRSILFALLVGLIIVSGLYIDSYMDNSTLMDDYVAQTSQLQAATSQLDIVQPLYDLTQAKPSRRYGDRAVIVSSYSINYRQDISDYPPSFRGVSFLSFYARFYAPADYLTLRIEPLRYYPLTELPFPLTLQRGDVIAEWSTSSSYSYPGESAPVYRNPNASLLAPIIWERNVTSNNIIEVNLPEAGWYTLCMTGPILQTGEGSIQFMGAITQTVNGTVHIPENVDIWIDFTLLWKRKS